MSISMKAIFAISLIVPIIAIGCSKPSPPKPTNSSLENHFTVPAITKDTKVGQLLLGKTTIKQALEILPAFSDHPPTHQDVQLGPEHIGKTREVLKKVVLGYNPMWSPLILLFDKNNKLIFVVRTFALDDEKKEAREIYEKYKHQLKEVYKDAATIMQGEIQPCITLEVTLGVSNEPNPIAFIYTCSTE